MKNPTVLAVIATLVIGIGFIGFLVLTQDDEIKESSDIAQIAEKLELDVEQFLADYESQEVIDLVEAQEEEAINKLATAGINGAQTPSVFINDEYYQRLQGVTLAQELELRISELPEEQLPLIVDVYEDYNCGACAAFQTELYEVDQTFTEDQVVLNKKHLPFLREASVRYARAAEAARLQGEEAFEEYNIELYLLEHDVDYDFYPFNNEAMENMNNTEVTEESTE